MRVKVIITLHWAVICVYFLKKCPTMSIFGTVGTKANLVDLKSWRKKAGEISQTGNQGCRRTLFKIKRVKQKGYFHRTASHCKYQQSETFNIAFENVVVISIEV